jgi:hypothetical protein
MLWHQWCQRFYEQLPAELRKLRARRRQFHQRITETELSRITGLNRTLTGTLKRPWGRTGAVMNLAGHRQLMAKTIA